jgi:hypothetical protein
MIDQDLIDRQTQQLLMSLKNQKEIIPGLYGIEEVLISEVVDKLKQHITITDQWGKVQDQEMLNRQSLTWCTDSVIEEIHVAFENITGEINESFPGTEKYFHGLQLWKDQEGYKLGYHTDNPVIDIAMQVYLYECPLQYGTTFNVRGTIIDLPFQHNTGYVMKNSAELLHKPSKSLPAGIVRYSLYAIWSRHRKYISNANDI